MPLELRQSIYKFLLPSTVRLKSRNRGVAWRRGQVAFLASCKQIHDEAANMLYGDNIFVIDVRYDRIDFDYRRLLDSELVPKRTPSFFKIMTAGNIRRMKYIFVSVTHPDSYFGMVNFDCGGAGLTSGLRNQVSKLVEALNCALSFSSVVIDSIDFNHNGAAMQSVLEPFASLHNVHHGIDIVGDVGKSFLNQMKAHTSPEVSE